MIKKEITFIYADAVQKQVFEMIAEEAEKRLQAANGFIARVVERK